MLSQEQFINQLFELRAQYRTDNAWVGSWDESWNDDEVLAKFIRCAFNLYEATARNNLKLTLLGGTEIRLDDQYIRNFGVTGVNGIQDESTRIHIRNARERWLKNYLYTGNKPPKPYAPVNGTGSILSEKSWTPILNDALIIGAITGGQDFALALTPEEQNAWKLMFPEDRDDPNTARPLGGKINHLVDQFGQGKSKWKRFLKTRKDMFIDPGYRNLRVFSRELLGLYFAGYEPVFTSQQLGFRPSNKPNPLDFKIYLHKLRKLGFQNSVANRRVLMQEISKFLFDDAQALGQDWTD
ncbi:hypothetical protein FLL45_04370 [Aliikangiella marina]|uniref:Uncharacterized protein n=1 Tax=Aliikangiella marina TaxID=1712262 RepID=A0A545TJ00_9GAMM|nr:hypothetical protein [Aliikangiella marina]TQV77188.1 hypothetical protein FLL45_04370 [Aliikangiella marina]